MFALIFSILLSSGATVDVMVGHAFETQAQCVRAWELTQLKGTWKKADGECVRIS